MTDPAEETGAELPDTLLWVKDAPMFIDEPTLERFYDATVRPTFEEDQERVVTLTKEQFEGLEAKISANAKFGAPGWLSSILSVGVDAGAAAETGDKTSESELHTIKMKVIKNPERQLEQLLTYYFLTRIDRLLIGPPKDALKWQEDGEPTKLPRAIAVLDIPAKTKVIPFAAEFSNGRIHTFFDKFAKPNGERAPNETGKSVELYKWLDENFDPYDAMVSVETAAVDHQSRIEWIDLRLILDESGKSMHLHIEPNGNYHTGSFAYRLIRRTYGHGMRIIGVLKDGPDLNVLAIYEK